MEDFKRDYIKEHFPKLTPEERREVLQSLPPQERREVLQSLPPQERRKVLQSLPPEELLAGLSAEQIRKYLDQRTAAQPHRPRKARRKR
jgi:Mg/Co/Ni transporter MgtE